MLAWRMIALIALAFPCFPSTVIAQSGFERIAMFENPIERERRFTGGREIEFSPDGTKMIAAFYGSTAQLFDLDQNVPIGEPIKTAGDGEVGFVNNEIAYTADWDSVRLWNSQSGQPIGDEIPHELREDTIIRPAISPPGNYLATRSTMNSVQLWNVTTREPVGEPLEYPSDVHSIRFSDGGEILLVRSGGSLYGIEAESAEVVAGPFRSEWLFYRYAAQRKLVTTEQVGDGHHQLVVRATDQAGWPETHRSDLPGKLKRMVALGDDRVLLQATNKDYTPAMFTFSLDDPEEREPVETNADRAFGVVVPENKQHWICTNIRNISCQKFGESKPVWQKQVPPSGYDQHLFPLDNEHFIIRDKDETLYVCKVANGNEVWSQPGVRRFSLNQNRIALGTSEGIEIWKMK